MNVNKIMLITPFLISIIVSIELDKDYYFDFYEFFMVLFISLMFFIDFWNYIHGENFWSLGNRISSTDSKLYRFYWFFLMLAIYVVAVFYFLFRV
ncbi:Uncharacterised protein [Moraxella cuniculi]|uniref:Uncharacterized protein n=1 Tax=Moraxella cuniculi TaxID=34061 RepID=A0A448GYS5_9GAMM|nr:Uncharacterised protein [Moraxella cuniculi]